MQIACQFKKTKTKKTLAPIFSGNVTCSAYALPQLDTIDNATGGIDKDSVLNLVVFGVILESFLLFTCEI